MIWGNENLVERGREGGRERERDVSVFNELCEILLQSQGQRSLEWIITYSLNDQGQSIVLARDECLLVY